MPKAAAIFNNVPRHHYLEFETPKNVVDFLDFNKNDVSKACNVSKESVRYDDKIPKVMQQRLDEIAIICGLVAEFFEGDIKKAAIWFHLKNPALGNISPRDMIRFGQFKKLHQFILAAINGETP